jgi:hypothetical protein
MIMLMMKASEQPRLRSSEGSQKKLEISTFLKKIGRQSNCVPGSPKG